MEVQSGRFFVIRNVSTLPPIGKPAAHVRAGRSFSQRCGSRCKTPSRLSFRRFVNSTAPGIAPSLARSRTGPDLSVNVLSLSHPGWKRELSISVSSRSRTTAGANFDKVLLLSRRAGQFSSASACSSRIFASAKAPSGGCTRQRCIQSVALSRSFCGVCSRAGRAEDQSPARARQTNRTRGVCNEDHDGPQS